jgi:molybdopterin molybdotransferase
MAAPERAWENPDEMIGVDEARERILRCIRPLQAIEVSILDALGMVAVEDVVASDNIPPFRNSAMDGYAIRSADTRDASPHSPVRVVTAGAIAAGVVPTFAIGPGEAARIMTGAPIPCDADAVVRFEEVGITADGGAIDIARRVRPSENVREAGEDIRAGQVVISAGTVLRPAAIGVMAALNRSTIVVHRRPRVSILATGDEVVEPGAVLRPGQIRNSNSYTLAALVRRAGGVPTLLGVARDAADDLRAKLAAGNPPDLYVTSGGVSVGDYDVVKDVLQADGRVDVWQVRMKPGTPLAFGLLGNTPLLGLPGNPVAAFVSFEQFGGPAIRRMLGFHDAGLPEVEAVLTERIENAGRRRHFVRGVLKRDGPRYVVRSTGAQGSGILSAMLQANCFIVISEACSAAEPGQLVRVQPFGDVLT